MKIVAQVFLALALAFSPGKASIQNVGAPLKFPPESVDELEIHSAKLDAVEVPNPSGEIAIYLGRRAVKLVNRAGITPAGQPANGETIAIVKGSDFNDGTIEAEVVGLPRAGAQPDVRGFVGVAFRVAALGS